MFIFNRPLQAVAAGLAVALLFVSLDRSCQPMDAPADYPSVFASLDGSARGEHSSSDDVVMTDRFPARGVMKTVRRVLRRAHPRVFDIEARAVHILYRSRRDGARHFKDQRAGLRWVLLFC